MNDLIEALNIFARHTNAKYPTHCEHDVLMICDLDSVLTDEEIQRVEDLGFFWSDEYDGYISFRFGSC